MFHATECETEYANDPDPNKHKENLLLYKDLTGILVNGYVAGISMALDLASFREFFPDAPADAPYFKCLSDVLTAFSNLTRENNAKPPTEWDFDEAHIDFTFDNRRESAHSAGQLYTAFLNQPEWAKDNTCLGAKLSFDTRANPRIQMADLIAREAMKEHDRKVGPVKRTPRKSLLALEKSGKFKFQERDRAYCENLRGRMAELEAETGMTSEGYGKWLFETGRVQNGRPHDTGEPHRVLRTARPAAYAIALSPDRRRLIHRVLSPCDAGVCVFQTARTRCGQSTCRIAMSSRLPATTSQT